MPPPFQIPWIESPTFESELAASAIPETLKSLALQYHRNGIVVFDTQISQFATTATSIVEGLNYRGETRLTNAWEFHPGVKSLATETTVIDLLRLLYRREPIPYQTLNFPVGTQQKTHSDSIHFASVPARYMCGVWIALEATDQTNGPLHYYPGSHRLPIIGVEDLGIGKSVKSVSERYRHYEDFIERFVKFHRLERQEIYLRPGQAVIWAANLLHGGSPIQDSARSRHSQVTHYFFSDCQYYAPIQSTVFDGKIQFISFKNIRTGSRVKQSKPPFINYFRLTSRYRIRSFLKTVGWAAPD